LSVIHQCQNPPPPSTEICLKLFHFTVLYSQVAFMGLTAQEEYRHIEFDVLTVESMKIILFGYETLCSPLHHLPVILRNVWMQQVPTECWSWSIWLQSLTSQKAVMFSSKQFQQAKKNNINTPCVLSLINMSWLKKCLTTS
jgi:hypothetical protein